MEWWCQHDVTQVVSTNRDTRVNVDTAPRCLLWLHHIVINFGGRYTCCANTRKWLVRTRWCQYDVTRVVSTHGDTRVDVGTAPLLVYYAYHHIVIYLGGRYTNCANTRRWLVRTMWHEQCPLNVTRWLMWTQPPIFIMLTAYKKRFRGRITRIIIIIPEMLWYYQNRPNKVMGWHAPPRMLPSRSIDIFSQLKRWLPQSSRQREFFVAEGTSKAIILQTWSPAGSCFCSFSFLPHPPSLRRRSWLNWPYTGYDSATCSDNSLRLNRCPRCTGKCDPVFQLGNRRR